MIQQPMSDATNRQWRQAGDTLRWLENSGPKYRDVLVGFISENGMRARVMVDGCVLEIKKSHMSFGSWYMCVGAMTGDSLELRLRDDPVRTVGWVP